jgi:hypothetical protein
MAGRSVRIQNVPQAGPIVAGGTSDRRTREDPRMKIEEMMENLPVIRELLFALGMNESVERLDRDIDNIRTTVNYDLLLATSKIQEQTEFIKAHSGRPHVVEFMERFRREAMDFIASMQSETKEIT